MEDMSSFVCTTIIPKLIEDLANLSTSPIDGIALTDIMHTRGINMRYLGKIAHTCSKKKNLSYVHVSCTDSFRHIDTPFLSESLASVKIPFCYITCIDSIYIYQEPKGL